jgi:hypothetical protein
MKLNAAAQPASLPVRWDFWPRSFLPATLPAQEKKNLTIDDLFDPVKKVDSGGTVPTGLSWLSDTHCLWPKTDPRPQHRAAQVEAATGKTVPFFDAARLESALLKISGVADETNGWLTSGRTP